MSRLGSRSALPVSRRFAPAGCSTSTTSPCCRAWRGQGIGRRLLRAVEAEARARGYCKITLEVRADNGAAMALYRRLGYGAGVSAGDAAQYLFMERRLGD